jgi:alcohol dehydrogenase class IV
VTETFDLSIRTRLIGGRGTATSHAPGAARDLGLERAYLVTDRPTRQSGKVQPIADACEAAGINVTAIHDEVPAGGDAGIAEEIAMLAAEAGADGFISVGPGVVTDMTKAAALIYTHEGTLADYAEPGSIARPLKPHLAIATLPGPAAEVTTTCALADGAGGLVRLESRFLQPDVAILDPDFLEGGRPIRVVAGGFSALARAVEGIASRQANPFSDGLHASALATIASALPGAATEGEDGAPAREALLYASAEAGLGFNSSRAGAGDALATALATLAGTPAGAAAAALIPEVVKALGDSLANGRWQLIADLVGATTSNANGVATALRALREQAGLPSELLAAASGDDALDAVVNLALSDPAVQGSPRKPDAAWLGRVLTALRAK